MALADNVLPYGLRDVKITPINADGSYGTTVDLPASRTLSFGETEEFEELRGDDTVVAIRGRGATVDWELEAGGISLAAWNVLSGGTLAETGSTPNEKRTFTKQGLDSRPYFVIQGKAISDSGGDFHVTIFKARADDSLEGELADGQFWLTSASGRGIPDDDDNLYEFVQNETAENIPSL